METSSEVFQVKRVLLLLTLLMAPAQAGDLGLADHVMYGVDAKNPDFTRTSFQTTVTYGDGKGGRGIGKTIASFEFRLSIMST